MLRLCMCARVPVTAASLPPARACLHTRTRTDVPVGDDQRQHLELAQSIAAAFNGTYSPVFTVPKGIFADGWVAAHACEPPAVCAAGVVLTNRAAAGGRGAGGVSRVMSLRDASAKMSKSDPSAASRIDLTGARVCHTPCWWGSNSSLPRTAQMTPA